MKKFQTIFACAMLVTLASCSNDHVLSQPGAEDTPIRIQANVGAVTTKAASNIQGTQFDPNEKIGIFLREHLQPGDQPSISYTDNTPLLGTTSTSGGKTMITFTTMYYPSNGRGVDCLAIYPKQNGSTDINNTTTTFSVQTDQSNPTEYKASDLMFAYTRNTKNSAAKTPIQLTFKHLLSKIIVEVKTDVSVNSSVLNDVYIDLLNTCKDIGITVGSMAQIATGTSASGESANVDVTVGTNPSTQTIINLGQPGVNSSDNLKTNEYAAIIVPQKINASTQFIQVRLNNNGTDYAKYIYAPTNDLIFDGEKSYKFTIKLMAGGISVESVKINDWDDKTTDLPDGGTGDANLQ